MDPIFSKIATDSPSRRVPITVSDEQIVKSLQDRLKTTLRDAPQPSVKERITVVDQVLVSMPTVWRQKSKSAQAALETFASKLTEVQKASLAEVSASLTVITANQELAGKKTQKTLPSVISLLNDFANSPDEASINFKLRLARLTLLIGQRASVADQSHVRSRLVRHSLIVAPQPLPAPAHDSNSSSASKHQDKYIGSLEFIADVQQFQLGLKQGEPSSGKKKSKVKEKAGSPRRRPKSMEMRSPAFPTTTTTTTTTTSTTTTALATATPATTNSTTADQRANVTFDRLPDAEKLRAIFARPGVLFSDQKTFKAVAKLTGDMDRFFQQEAVLGMFKLTVALFDDAVDRRGMEHQAGLKLAIAKANLNPAQEQSLKQAWLTVKDNGRILGQSEEASTLMDLLLAVTSLL
jgi:hypothetical protein